MVKNKNFYAVNKFELNKKIRGVKHRSTIHLEKREYEIKKTIDTSLRRITLQPVIKNRI
jgi:hypothetical protein